jgi:hypothetical protein
MMCRALGRHRPSTIREAVAGQGKKTRSRGGGGGRNIVRLQGCVRRDVISLPVFFFSSISSLPMLCCRPLLRR